MILKTKLEMIEAKLAELSETIASEIENCKEELKTILIEDLENEIAEIKPAKKKR